MIIISYGVEKSGSTLAFEMTKAVLELNGCPQRRLPPDVLSGGPNKINELGPWSDERLTSLAAATHDTKIVIRTHNAPRKVSPELVTGLLEAGDLKIHTAFRDPRDTVLSILNDGFRARRLGEQRHAEVFTVDDAIARLAPRLSNLRLWGSFPSLRLIYDQYAFDRSFGPRLIADDLGMEIDPDEVWELLDLRHTRRNVAQPERYKTELSRDEIARIERAFPLYLDVVGGSPPVGWFARPGGTG